MVGEKFFAGFLCLTGESGLVTGPDMSDNKQPRSGRGIFLKIPVLRGDFVKNENGCRIASHTSEKLWWHVSLINTCYVVIDGCLIKLNQGYRKWGMSAVMKSHGRLEKNVLWIILGVPARRGFSPRKHTTRKDWFLSEREKFTAAPHHNSPAQRSLRTVRARL
jgi:hypothetical protein